jgi:hypothetical protein
MIFAMKYLVSFTLGAFSGFLIFLMGLAFFSEPGRHINPSNRLVMINLLLPSFILFLIGWAVSTLLLVRRAEDSVRVIQRGSLLGAGEWLLFYFAWVIFGRPAPFQGRVFDDDGIKSMIITGIMILVCLATYAVARFMSPERAPDPVIQMNQPILKQCSRCGQLAEIFARFCNSCGTPFVAGGLGETNMSRE